MNKARGVDCTIMASSNRRRRKSGFGFSRKSLRNEANFRCIRSLSLQLQWVNKQTNFEKSTSAVLLRNILVTVVSVSESDRKRSFRSAALNTNTGLTALARLKARINPIPLEMSASTPSESLKPGESARTTCRPLHSTGAACTVLVTELLPGAT